MTLKRNECSNPGLTTRQDSELNNLTLALCTSAVTCFSAMQFPLYASYRLHCIKEMHTLRIHELVVSALRSCRRY